MNAPLGHGTMILLVALTVTATACKRNMYEIPEEDRFEAESSVAAPSTEAAGAAILEAAPARSSRPPVDRR